MATANSVNNKLGPTDSLVMSSAGAMNLAQQPCFLAYRSSDVTNVTGTGTAYQIIFDTILFDKVGNYTNGDGLFTCSQTGIYQFDVAVRLLHGTLSLATLFTLSLVTTQNTFIPIVLNANAASTVSSGVGQSFSLKVPMTLADTAKVIVTVTGGGVDNVGIAGGTIFTYFSGALLN